MTTHGIRWYVAMAALGALAGFGIGMTIVKAVGWYPHPEVYAPRTRWRSLLPDPPPPAGADHVDSWGE